MLGRLFVVVTSLCLSLFGLVSCEGCAAPPIVDVDGGTPPGDAEDAGNGGAACSVDDDCPFGERCNADGECEPAEADIGDVGCASDLDCGLDELCATSTGRCVNEAPVPNVPTGPPGPCVVNEERTCGIKVGVCDYGIERCVADVAGTGGVWSGECLGAIGPSAEACDGDDDDCDGADDNGFNVNGALLGDVCSAGGGACELPGVVRCTADATAAFCDVPPEAGETCNGQDDDGDGCFDEGFALGIACTEGVGGCVETGVTICNQSGTGTVCSVAGRPPAQETCDNDDDDCDNIADNGCDDDLDGHCDAVLGVGTSFPVAACAATTSAAALDCNDTNPDVHPGLLEVCNDGLDTNCDGNLNDGCAPCNVQVDADFDGANQCDDCDETNGAIRPGATERCDGLDQNCNGTFDETFDADGDGFTTCGTISLASGGLDPARIDCNDTPGAGDEIFPGACELCANAAGSVACGAANDRGNNVDEDCDGFVDELCAPCDAVDRDGDQVSECEGDCNPTNGQVRPGIPERCDGLDTDCNVNTTENCDVGDECNFPGDADVCRDRLICVEELSGGGMGTGSFSCTSLCNTSTGGAGFGDSCDSDETCGAFLTPTSNLHGCSVTVGFGAAVPGEDCSNNNGNECRSGRCLKDFRFTGNVKYCFDFCGSDAYCPSSPEPTTCQSAVGEGTAHCKRLLTGQNRAVGDSCSAANQAACVNGSASCVQGECRAICCNDADCAGGEHCALEGPTVPSPAGGVDTVPICLPDVGGNGGRQAGAACTTSAQCESEFCDVALGVCVDPCCNDTQCPLGLLCESAITTLSGGAQTFARMCLSATPAGPLEAR